ncbi:hypothetical protein [Flavobacterium sp. AG291]|uniref:hypothetical protein n=1 Tax=Flavobacterium sp. AG291 TaxID=2184000 RepID=UPI000E0BD81A|nr:hypothetical protein [Flavobacterium sp. AG291]RDI07017.1 hypothetical protein DEU42_113116 [Flavobacterium sp. AG291]
MVRFTDILIHLLCIFILFAGTIIIIVLDTPYLFFIPFIIVIALKIYFERKKKILPYVKDDFAELGYELLSERPLKFSETKTTMRLYTGVKINDIPIERYGYLKKITRVFTAKDKDGIIHELQATVTKEWNGSNSIEIKTDKIISNENS